MQECRRGSTYYSSDGLFCYFYWVPFLSVNLANSTYVGSEHLDNGSLMSAIWYFDLEVIQKLHKFLAI